MYLCWRGQCPKGVPAERKHVDPGSKMYVETVAKVPILAPKDHYYARQAVRDLSLASTMGATAAASAAPPPEVPGATTSGVAEEEPEGPPSTRLAASGVKRRRLYRQASSGDLVAWSPRDQPKVLLKEFVDECGGDKVKWVFYGTPAAGNGVLGCVEAGCCVIANCEDDHHASHFQTAIVEKGVEAFLAGESPAFGNPFLAARATDLVPGCKELDKEADKEKQEKQDKADKKGTRKGEEGVGGRARRE